MDSKQQLLDQILGLGPVMPVLVIDEVVDAVPLARALVDNGVRVLEVTLRTPQALACMEAFSTTDFREDLKQLTVPTLVIHGSDDQIVPLDISGKASAAR